MKAGLLLIDVQNEYFLGGAIPLEGMEEVVENCRQLLEHFRKLNLPIFHVQQHSIQSGAAFFVPYTKGYEIHPRVQPQPNETLVVKHYPNAFRETILSSALQNAQITHLIIVGAMVHLCVDATVRAAFDLGYTCTVIADACATREIEYAGKTIPAETVHAAFMSSLSFPFASIISTQQLLTYYRLTS